jgi:hypothetical protein
VPGVVRWVVGDILWQRGGEMNWGRVKDAAPIPFEKLYANETSYFRRTIFFVCVKSFATSL